MIALRQHVRRHQEEMNEAPKSSVHTFRCYVCGKIYNDPEKMKSHLKLHTVIPEHKCAVCNTTCLTADKLKIHMLKHKNNQSEKSKERSKSKIGNKVIYMCRECGEEHKTLTSMKEHLIVHNTEVKAIFSHLKYKCVECSSEHETIYEFFQHTATHNFSKESSSSKSQTILSGRPTYKCQTCNKLCRSRSDLLRHEKTHDSHWPRKCRYCDEIIAKKIDFLPHLNANHEDMKNFICNQCGKRFFKERNLVSHVKIHSGERNYMCDICGFSFQAQNNLVSKIKFTNVT